ncbi:hypothetical protein NP233_g3462 [Leucocoprinus birnbaumii]|uniref:Uncharacterized protein n=1 Tax=Leucocoprinus birnbaumii TaxID=56174 RepID=A0AAD5VWJ6_9AGAR|nr:hypothetical protein NP233_g3462 [Leucocoprinus birnbaumii]
MSPKFDSKAGGHEGHLNHPLASPPSRLTRIFERITRIGRLLLIGYASEETQRSYEAHRHWEQLHTSLLRKIENIGVVSGLLLASNANLLVSSNGDLRRMTYISVGASILAAIISLILDLLCLWALIGMHPSRLQLLTKRSLLFYYLCGTPSVFGGASALSFFVAVGSWVWLDAVNQDRNGVARFCAVALGAILMLNTCVCFYLGSSMKGRAWVYKPIDASGEARQMNSNVELPRRSGGSSPVSDVIANELPT